MKYIKWLVFILMVSVISSTTILGQQVCEDLKIFEPLLNKTWKGELTSPDGKETWPVIRRFTPLWDGSVVRYQSEVPVRNSYSEGFFFWDVSEKKVAVFIVGTRGIYQKGYVSLEEGVLTLRGIIHFPDRQFDYCNTFELTDEGKLVDRWFQNAFGSWRGGHVVELTAG